MLLHHKRISLGVRRRAWSARRRGPAGPARGAADLVLGDDSFATLTYGVREGRRIVDNVLKGLVFLTSTHVALLGFVLLGPLAGFTQPLLPLQILWLRVLVHA